MFLKVNLLTTSGPSSVGLLYKESVGTIMTEAQFIEAVGLSNVLPGSEALKLAMFVGYAAAGFPGVIISLIGAILPPTVNHVDGGKCFGAVPGRSLDDKIYSGVVSWGWGADCDGRL